MKSNAPAPMVSVARALHPEGRGWVAAIGDRSGFGRPLWLPLHRSNWTQRLRRFSLDQGGARLSIASYRRPGSKAASKVRNCRWVMLDADASDLWQTFPIEPSIVVASGGRSGGTDHKHVLWRIDGTVEVCEVGRLIAGQRDILDGDPGFNAGVTATVRLPRDSGDILVFEPGRVATAHDLRRHHRSAVPKPPRAPARTPADRKASVAMAVGRALTAVAQGESRNSTGWRLAGDLWSRGLTEDEAIEAGESYVVEVELAKAGDDPYTPQEWRDQVRRHFEHGAVLVDPKHVERVDVWETGWLTNRRYGSSQKTLVSAVAGLARAGGSDQVMLSRRTAMIFARLSRGAVDRGFEGSKTKDGLIETALELKAKPRRGSKDGSLFQLLDPPSPPTTTPLSPSLGLVLSPLVFTSQTVPPNHDAFRVTGHGPRLVLDVLLGLDRPASIAELAGSPVLSDHKRTIRRQLQRLQELGIVTRSENALWRPVDDLEVALDLVAEETERMNEDGVVEGWSERTHRHHEAARRSYELALDPVESKRREGDQLRRVLRRSKRLSRPTSTPHQNV